MTWNQYIYKYKCKYVRIVILKFCWKWDRVTWHILTFEDPRFFVHTAPVSQPTSHLYKDVKSVTHVEQKVTLCLISDPVHRCSYKVLTASYMKFKTDCVHTVHKKNHTRMSIVSQWVAAFCNCIVSIQFNRWSKFTCYTYVYE